MHPPCSIYVLDSPFPQPLSRFSLVFLLVWGPLLHTTCISSPSHLLLFAAHAHTIAACSAVVPVLCHLYLVSSFTYLSFTLTSHVIWPLGTIKGCIYCLSHKWTYLNNCLAMWYSSYHRLAYERSYPTSGPVNTGIGHCLWMTIPSRYVTSQLGQLSLASLHLTKSKTSLIWLECSEVWP